jgi:5'-methylthioinosine phosphorylase
MTTAIIGGSGFCELADFQAIEERMVATPFGSPSTVIVHGELGGQPLHFLARHGEGHSIAPHLVNYRANIHALAESGVTHVVALLAVGGIDLAYKPGSLAVPDQLIDYTWGRESTYFDGSGDSGLDPDRRVRHVEFTDPFCPDMRNAAIRSAEGAGIDIIDGGTYGVTQGPRFETAAEIRRMSRDGAHIVGMTAMPEAGLAREAGLCYLGVAMSVNYAAGVVPGAVDPVQIETAFESVIKSVTRLLPPLLDSVSTLDCNAAALISG